MSQRDATSITFDTIIVGAGPAGCVLASRLTDDRGQQVLLVEAGSDFGSSPESWPDELLDPVGPVLDEHSWGYEHQPDVNGRRLQLPRGKVFGGCSAVNSCIWLHGSRADYDDWANQGNPGWDHQHLAPYFERAERDPLRSKDGHQNSPVNVWRVPNESLSVIDHAVMATADELGIPQTADLNASADQEPQVGPTPKNLRDGKRLNAALSYLAIARSRPNLHLLADTLVDRVVLDGRLAAGVITSDGVVIRGHEVILSAGAYGSPAILLRSGIGPVDHLHDLGIPLVHSLPGVGENLMDHPYLAPYTSGRTSFVITRSAEPGRRIFIQTMIKARSRQVANEIDLHIYPRELPDDESGRWVLGFGISLQYSRSRGRIRLTSRNPQDSLDIDHRYFENAMDLEALTDGVEFLDRLTSTQPLASLLDGPARSTTRNMDREAIQSVIRAEVGTTFHPSSSCRMGPESDPMSVVDQAGRVRGIDRLRVVDASIFPSGPRCNLHAPTVAVAERMSDLIRARRNQ